jgi:hypothetical protein
MVGDLYSSRQFTELRPFSQISPPESNALPGIPVSGHGRRRRLHDPPESNALVQAGQAIERQTVNRSVTAEGVAFERIAAVLPRIEPEPRGWIRDQKTQCGAFKRKKPGWRSSPVMSLQIIGAIDECNSGAGWRC